jgi:hypothetical protein
MINTGYLKVLQLSLFVLLCGVFVPTAATAAEEQPDAVGTATAPNNSTETRYLEIIALLQEQEEKTSRELGRIKREITVLRQQLDKPGITEIMGGIGYILGLFGVAAYTASRKKKDRGE